VADRRGDATGAAPQRPATGATPPEPGGRRVPDDIRPHGPGRNPGGDHNGHEEEGCSPRHELGEAGTLLRLWLYWENNANTFNAVDISIPAAVTVFPGEIYQAPRSWIERAYHKLVYFNTVDKGGHFAAREQPELFTSEVRTAFKSLR
jgi:pimeloyl-ACP methyl ester carboxylesterase